MTASTGAAAAVLATAAAAPIDADAADLGVQRCQLSVRAQALQHHTDTRQREGYEISEVTALLTGN